MDTRRLRHFLAVYESGSLGHAAARLRLTQPAVSKSLKALEDELQVKLFDRTPLGVVPTVFGEALAVHAKVIQSEIGSAENQMSALRGATRGHVIVGIAPSMADNIMPIATAKLHRWRPGIRLTVVEGIVEDLVPALRRGELDMAICSLPVHSENDLVTEVVIRDDVRILAGDQHPLAHRLATIEDLLAYPWAVPAQKQFIRHHENVFLSHGVKPPVAMVTSNSASYLRALLAKGNFLSYLPRRLINCDTSEPLAPIVVESPSLALEVTLTYRERATVTAAAKALQAVLRDVAASEQRSAVGSASVQGTSERHVVGNLSKPAVGYPGGRT